MKIITTSPLVWMITNVEMEDRLDAQGCHPTKINMISTLKHVSETYGWKISKLTDVAKVLHQSLDPQNYPSADFIHVGVGDINSATGWAVEQKVKGMELLSQKVVFKRGDILFSKIRPYLNKVTLIPKSLEWGLGSSEFYIVRAKQEQNRYYLFAYLRSRLTLEQTVPPLTGSSRPRLRKEDIEDIKILIPETTIFEKISRKVEDAEALRESAKKIYFKLESLQEELKLTIPKVKETIILRAKSDELITRLDSEFYYYKNEISKVLQKYPYEVKPLNEVAFLSKKRTNPTRTPTKKIRYVEIADVNPNSGEVENWSEILGSEAPSRARMILKEGNVVLSSLKGSLRSIAIVPPELDNAIGTTGFFVLKPNEEVINKESLWWMLRTDVCQRQLEQIASGAIMPAINEKELKKVMIPIPPPEVQKEIKDKVEEIQKLRREANRLVKEAIRDVEELIEGKK
jgi:restriction endonuclease S subunit